MTREELLAVINKDLKPDVDWTAGAQRYVKQCFDEMGREGIEHYLMIKPLGLVGSDPSAAIDEIAHYLHNFTNAISLLKLPGGSRVLDVACGSGWVSHYLSKLGYWTYGVDISADFIRLAKKRLLTDPLLPISPVEAGARFSVLDIETTPLPEHLRRMFDVVWLESCLHHFLDPIAALEHLADALKPDGVLVLIEFENRMGPIKAEYQEVMDRFDTLERPYPRSDLVRMLDMAGFGHHEFLAAINGWRSPDAPPSFIMDKVMADAANGANLAICAKTAEPINRLFPHRLTRQAVTFGRGFYAEEGGFRWVAPSAELIVNDPAARIVLDLHAGQARLPPEGQLVCAYSDRRDIGRVILPADGRPARLEIRDAIGGEQITLASAYAFVPAWDGSSDRRLLSYYLSEDQAS